jgi:hypothetical protein
MSGISPKGRDTREEMDSMDSADFIAAEKNVDLALGNERLRRQLQDSEAQCDELRHALALSEAERDGARARIEAREGRLREAALELEAVRRTHTQEVQALRARLEEMEVAAASRPADDGETSSYAVARGGARKAGKERRAGAAVALSSADPLLRQQQKLKDDLAKARREASSRKSALEQVRVHDKITPPCAD